MLVKSCLARGLTSFAGYDWIWLDDCWTRAPRDPASQRLVPDPDRFPHGIKWLSEQLHKLGMASVGAVTLTRAGLHFGIYLNYGRESITAAWLMLCRKIHMSRSTVSWQRRLHRARRCYCWQLGGNSDLQQALMLARLMASSWTAATCPKRPLRMWKTTTLMQAVLSLRLAETWCSC